MTSPSLLHVVSQAPKRKKPDTRVGLLNSAFKYIPAASTDVKATFERVRAELAQKGKTR
jgi:hypothetical protein